MPQPQATAATMTPNLAPPEVAASLGASSGPVAPALAPAPSASNMAEAPPRRRQRRQGPPVGGAARSAPGPEVAALLDPDAARPLTETELQDLGVLQVLAGRAGVPVEAYVDDHRGLIRSFERFQAYVAAKRRP